MSRIIGLKARNVKRLHAVEITPEGHIVEISGRNGQGKTSVLDSIAYALGGAQLQPSQPMRRGASSAEVSIELDDLVVTRRWTAKGSYLSVTTPEGSTLKSPQKVLDALVGRLTFDPLAFTRMRADEQAATLREVAGLDFGAIDQARQHAYEQRTDVNRELKAEQARLDAMPNQGACPNDPGEEISVADLLEKRKRMEEELADNNRQRQELDDAVQKVDQASEDHNAAIRRVAELEEALRVAKEEADETGHRRGELAAEASRIRERVGRLTDPALFAIDDKLAKADEHNRHVRNIKQRIREVEQAQERRVEQAERVGQLRRESNSLTETIERANELKQQMLSEAKLPIQGLAIDDDGVTYQGIPFDQCSAAEQLRVSVAMGLAANPKLRVMLIRDGSLLDEQSRKLLAEMAETHDAQIWIEVVSDGDPVGVVIEDGRVLGSEAEEEQPATA